MKKTSLTGHNWHKLRSSKILNGPRPERTIGLICDKLAEDVPRKYTYITLPRVKISPNFSPTLTTTLFSPCPYFLFLIATPDSFIQSTLLLVLPTVYVYAPCLWIEQLGSRDGLEYLTSTFESIVDEFEYFYKHFQVYIES